MATPSNSVPQRHRVPAHLARRFHQVCLGITAEVTERADLTPVEFAVIAALAEAPDTDQGSLAAATLRCVGVGKCRRDEGGVMCPSFRVTRDEEHSTRGRAHLLWEMTKGDVIKDGWQNEAVKESLELCLACKGCKSDCPVGVDVATYKAEFLSHYYESNRRPLNAVALSSFDLWVRVASLVPGLVNITTQLPGLRDLAKLAGGIAAQRRIPPFAPQTFKQWWERR